MKKSILLVLLVAFLAVAVGVSGCLDNNDNGNTTNNTTNTTPTPPATPPTFDNNIVQVDPIPAGFELLVVKNVTADSEGIGGLTDALAGYSATYMYNDSISDTVYLYAFECSDTAAAAGYVQDMIDAHIEKYPGTNNVTTAKVNGHDATLLTRTVTSGSAGDERYELAWNNGPILVVVNGPASYNLILSIAEASGL